MFGEIYQVEIYNAGHKLFYVTVRHFLLSGNHVNVGIRNNVYICYFCANDLMSCSKMSIDISLNYVSKCLPQFTSVVVDKIINILFY